MAMSVNVSGRQLGDPDFPEVIRQALDAHGLPSSFHGKPNEIADAVSFADDAGPISYSLARQDDDQREMEEIDEEAFMRILAIDEVQLAGDLVGRQTA